jgi:hypothetical protein
LPTSGQARRGEAFRTPPGSKDSNGKEEPSGAAGSLSGYFYEVLFRVSSHTQAAVLGGVLVYKFCAEAAQRANIFLFPLIVYNPPMTSSNWIKTVIAVIVGIALGVVYGWVIDPIEYTDVTPNILREDYRADYVLMVAESHQSELDSETSARRLAILGSESPVQIVSSTLDYAIKNNFTQNEIDLLQGLLTAMQIYQPQGVNAP